MQYFNKQYNERQLALIAQVTKASREEILEVVRLSNIKLEAIVQCISKTRSIYALANQFSKCPALFHGYKLPNFGL